MDRNRSSNVKIDMNVMEWTALESANNSDSSNFNKRKSSATKHTDNRNYFDDGHISSISVHEDRTKKVNMKNEIEVENRERSNELIHRSNIHTRKNAQLDKNYKDQDISARNNAEVVRKRDNDPARLSTPRLSPAEDVRKRDNDPARLSTPRLSPAEDVRKRDNDPARLSTPRLSPTANTAYGPESRPGSVCKKTPLSERHMSSFSANGASPRPSSSRKLGRHGLKAHQASNGEEDDEDISLEGLSELLGTVRQYAQEIHEIYAPIKKDEEERIRRKDERNSRRKSKENNSGLTIKSDRQIALPIHQEVRVEIHKTGDQLSERFVEEGRRTSKHEALSFSKSHDPSASKQVASLHVEEEKLSKTWPRGQKKPRSRERFCQEVTQNKQNPYPTSTQSYVTRSKTPADWNEASSIQHEKEMLNKAFQRIHKPSEDPLLGTSSKGLTRSQIFEQMMNSRQSVIEVARQHKQSRQIALPSISIISPATEYRRRSWNPPVGALHAAPFDDDNSFPATTASAPPLEEEFHGMNIITNTREVSGEKIPSRQPRDRSTNVKASATSGPRRRKSFNEGEDSYNDVVEKY